MDSSIASSAQLSLSFDFITFLQKITSSIVKFIWNDSLILLFFFLGCFFTVLFGAFQIRLLPLMYRLSMVSDKSDSGISSLQAFIVSASGRIGTGNIVGVASALAIGGPGSIFWMWLSAIFGCASSFIESSLGQLYKIKYNGEYRAGVALYIYKILNRATCSENFAKNVAIVVAIIIMLTEGGLLVGIGAEAIGASFEEVGIDRKITILFVLISFMIIVSGGIKSVARASEYLIIFMGVLYITFVLYIMTLYYQKIPTIIYVILSSAFDTRAVVGGLFGAVFKIGIMRGVLSNEAGLGSSGPHIGGAAESNHPAEQGLVQAFVIYIDTILFCTLTALILITTDCYNFVSNDQILHKGIISTSVDASKYIIVSSSLILGDFMGPIFIALVISLFAITTMSAIYYIAETNAEIIDYFRPQMKIFGKSWVLFLCKSLSIAIIMIAAFGGNAIAWNLADIGTGVAVMLNILALIFGAPIAYRIYNDYIDQIKDANGRVKTDIHNVKFNPESLNIKDADFWSSKKKLKN